MDYACTILADTIGPHGIRLTTIESTFPRMVLADRTRHRAHSYSYESTRAVPVEVRIEQARKSPFVPIFRERVKGMAMGVPLEGTAQTKAQWKWIQGAHAAADLAESLLHVEKGLAGRVLEPYLWITGIVTATDWDNYFNLRCHPAAQFEIQAIAKLERQAMRDSAPTFREFGDWHLPLVTDHERKALTGVHPHEQAHVSAGRCASTSYMKQHAGEGNLASAARWNEKLAPSAHWSPGEHPAQVVDTSGYIGNFRGYKQLRKFYANEAVAENPA